MSHPFTEATLAVVARKLDNALALFEEYADDADGVQDPKMRFSRAYGELLQIRGALHAAQQLEALTEEIAEVDTERPSSVRCIK